MNTVTITDLRNQFRRVSALLDQGESVQVLKRGKPYAMIVPVVKSTLPERPRVDFRSLRDAIWRGRTFSTAEVAEMRAAEHENGF